VTVWISFIHDEVEGVVRTLSHSCVGGQAYGDYPSEEKEGEDEMEFLIVYQTEPEDKMVYGLEEMEAK
jgi:hypothetical protein